MSFPLEDKVAHCSRPATHTDFGGQMTTNATPNTREQVEQQFQAWRRANPRANPLERSRMLTRLLSPSWRGARRADNAAASGQGEINPASAQAT